MANKFNDFEWEGKERNRTLPKVENASSTLHQGNDHLKQFIVAISLITAFVSWISLCAIHGLFLKEAITSTLIISALLFFHLVSCNDETNDNK